MKTSNFFTGILALLFLISVGSFFISNSKDTNTRKARIDNLFDPGPLHGGLIERVTVDLIVPESFDHIKTEYQDLGGNQIKVDMYFKASNEYGVPRSYCAHATLDTMGKITFYKIE